MSSVSAKVTLLILSCTVGACAIHPLPEDVTGVKTATIVHKIRCEARNAIIDSRIKYLHRHYPDVVDVASMRNRIALGVSRLIDYNLKYFNSTGIVYSFTLDGTETNAASFTADVIKPLTHGTATVTPSAGNTVSRQNVRTFTISDNFGGLIDAKNDKYCDDIMPPYPNYEYPIVGRVGVDEMVTTFIELTLFDALSPKSDATAPKPTNAAPIAMVDTLNFMTTISAGVTGKVSFMPAGTNWQLMDAMLPLSAMRVDKHQVIIGLALSGPYTPPGILVVERVERVRGWGWAAARAVVSPNPRLIVSRPAKMGTGEAVALEAVNNQILRFEVPKSLVVVP